MGILPLLLKVKMLEMTAIRGATEEEAVAYSIGGEVSDGNAMSLS